MARSLLIRLLRDQRGFTLTEQLVVASGLVVILGAILGLADLAAKSAPTDRERLHAVREAQVEMDKMVRELRKAYSLSITNSGFRVQAQLLDGGVAATVTYNCSDAPVNGVRKCIRSQTGGNGSPPTQTVLPRIANATSRPVFTAQTRNNSAGTPYTTYVRVIVEVPSRGERTTGGTARTVLDDGFYLRNADALRAGS
jgi:type II secretory pathway pseudopilin PulG